MVKKKSKSKDKESKSFGVFGIPEGVVIISILMFFSALMSFLLGLSMFNVANPQNYRQSQAQFQALGGGMLPVSSFIYIGLLFVVLGFISFFIGRGLLMLQKRARIALIIVLIAGVLSSIYLIVKAQQYYTGAFVIIVQLVALWYISQKKVKRHFKN